ncbi:EamA-like transporter family protein [Rubripirellula tenax]|uniref:EamA-like transporter family protein n=1 Tax=Rubripirellula tenax TaxID=2528015 RepID=A0A5C6EMU9_9BACT|nr:DMT family transporter [Rubripirellula tenax]TWU48886.1 EamA-like transporter family protein [Rubripirellula tenax]
MTEPTDGETNNHGESAIRFRSGVVLAIVGTFLFALKSIFIKLAFAEGVGATLLLTLRMFLALPFYVFVFWSLRSRADRKPIATSDLVRSLGLGFLGYYLASYLDLSGLEYISAQLERLTLFTYPAMVALLAWLFLGEKIDRRIIAAIALCYFGVVMMYGQEQALTSSSDVRFGVALVVGAALSYSFYILFAKPTMQRIGSREFTSLAMIGSTFFVGVHFAITDPIASVLNVNPIVYVYGFVLAFVCTVLPSFMINEAIVRIGATRTTVIGSVGPVLTMGLAIGILGEPTSIQHIGGMVIAILGVSFVAKK